jgi:hypothetical protein
MLDKSNLNYKAGTHLPGRAATKEPHAILCAITNSHILTSWSSQNIAMNHFPTNAFAYFAFKTQSPSLSKYTSSKQISEALRLLKLYPMLGAKTRPSLRFYVMASTSAYRQTWKRFFNDCDSKLQWEPSGSTPYVSIKRQFLSEIYKYRECALFTVRLD